MAAVSGRMSDEERRTSGEVGAERDAGARRRRGWAQHVHQARRQQIAEERDAGRRRRRGGAAQIAVLAGVARAPGRAWPAARRQPSRVALWQMTENGSTLAPLAANGTRPSRKTCRATA